MKKKTLKILLIIMLVLIALGIGMIVLLYFYNKNQAGFLKGTTLNGEDVSGKTPETVAAELSQEYNAFPIQITEDGTVVLEGDLGDFGFSFDEDTLLEELTAADAAEKENFLSVLQTVLGGRALQLDAAFSYDEETFDAFVVSSNFSVARFASSEAQYVLNETGTEYTIQEAIQGNEIDDASLQQYVQEQIQTALSEGAVSETLTIEIPDEYYTSEEVSTDTSALEAGLADKNKELKLQNAFGNMSVTYTFGTQTQVLDSATIISWASIDDDYNITLDDTAIATYVSELAATYDTRSGERTFTTTSGETITFSNSENQYGYIINQESECEQLKAELLAGEPVTREPVYYQTNSYGNPWYLSREGTDDLNGTYVEVSISEQHVWFYKDGVLIADGDCVTGDVSEGHDTTTGVYALAYKQSPATLTGGDAADGYSSDVTYWMPFNDGQGLHDATWRSTFGGTIYQTSGSHGCVNLPYSLAQTIYENIEAGTAIVVHA